VKDDLQGYSSFRKCTEAEEKLTVALRYALDIVVKINVNYIYTRKRVTPNFSKLEIYKHKHAHQDIALTYLL